MVNLRALSLIGRVPNCRLGWSQFESGRARICQKKKYILYNLKIFFLFCKIKRVYILKIYIFRHCLK